MPLTNTVDPDLDADPDPAIFVIDLPKFPRGQQKTNFLQVFLLIAFLKVLVHHFQR
jgi:hypothetical protein